MRFSKQGLLAEAEFTLPDSLRKPLPSVAEPQWFAPPVDVRDGPRAITVAFQLPDDDTEARVELSEMDVIVWGPRPSQGRRPMRVFSFPTAVDPRSVRRRRAGRVLYVSASKRRKNWDASRRAA